MSRTPGNSDAPAATADASTTPDATSVFIFQLPATMLL